MGSVNGASITEKWWHKRYKLCPNVDLFGIISWFKFALKASVNYNSTFRMFCIFEYVCIRNPPRKNLYLLLLAHSQGLGTYPHSSLNAIHHFQWNYRQLFLKITSTHDLMLTAIPGWYFQRDHAHIAHHMCDLIVNRMHLCV